jgi:anthranilate synthase component 1
MDNAQFAALAAQGYDRIPLTLETYADLDTPLSLYLKLANAPNSFLLESVVGGERFGRYSFIGLPARRLLRSGGFATEVVEDGAVIERDAGNPLDFVERYQQRQRVHVPPGMPRFCGGLAGYFGYDAVRYIEPRLARFDKPDDIGTPDILLLETQELAVVDNLAGTIQLIVYVDPAAPDAAGAPGRPEMARH